MKRQQKHIVTRFYQIGSLLLVSIFLSITLVQALHGHHQVNQIEKSQHNDDDIVSGVDQCKICDFMTQKQSKFLHLSYPTVFTIKLPDPVSYGIYSCIGNYKFTLQGFTNKGPPAESFCVRLP